MEFIIKKNVMVEITFKIKAKNEKEAIKKWEKEQPIFAFYDLNFDYGIYEYDEYSVSIEKGE